MKLSALVALRLGSTILFAVLFAALNPRLSYAQPSGHQRLGRERTTSWEAEIEMATRLITSGVAGSGLPELHSSLSLGVLIDRTVFLGVNLPASLYSTSSHSWNPLLVPRDLIASLGYTALLGETRFRAGFDLSCPSGLWLGNQEVPGLVAGGSGRWTLGLVAGFSRIVDPLVLGGLLSWHLGLPRTENWKRMWRPGDISLLLSATEVFNEYVSASAFLSQALYLPPMEWGRAPGIPAPSLIASDTSAGLRLSVSLMAFAGSIGFSKSLVHGENPGEVLITLTWVIRRKEQP